MRRTGLRDMPVEGFVDRPVFVSPYAELPELFDILDSEDAVFVGDERGLDGIVTTVDVLRWLHDLAEPFVRLGEIEKSLREIVSGGCRKSRYPSAPTNAHAELRGANRQAPAAGGSDEL